MSPQADNLYDLIEYLRMKQPALLYILASQSDEEFDVGLEGILEEATAHLERNANHLASLNEEAISAFLVAYLSMPGLRALQEAHSNGHVDITIEAEKKPPLRRRLGEAKIYNGPSYHVKGLEQLLGRYTTGREGSGFLVEYVKDPNIVNLAQKVRDHIDEHRPCNQNGKSQTHHIRWAFTTHHNHSSGESFRVLHLSCNLHRSDGGQ